MHPHPHHALPFCALRTTYPQDLYVADQLMIQALSGNLSAFGVVSEAPPAFPPSYKYDVGTNAFDTSVKRRVPSWTDRILFSTGLWPLYYDAVMDMMSSDHKPVVAGFEVNVVTDTTARTPLSLSLSPRPRAERDVLGTPRTPSLSSDVKGMGVVRSEVCAVM